MINIEENDYEIVPEKIINFFTHNQDLLTEFMKYKKSEAGKQFWEKLSQLLMNLMLLIKEKWTLKN